MANPLIEWLRGGRLPRPEPQPIEQTQQITQRKLYLYPDYLNPTLATQPDLNAAIRLGMLVHGPGATEMTYRAWHHEDSNSAVFACLRYICTAAPEAPLTVYKLTEPGDQDTMPEHPLQDFLNKPNPHLTMRELEYYKQWCKHVNGNAYWRKIRSGQGNVVMLWPLSPLRVVPVTTKEDAARGVFISYYAYKYDPAKDPELIPPADIVHFRLGLDDKDHRVGVSPLSKLLREVMSDEEATHWQSTLLGNGGAASMVVEVPVESTMTEDQAESLKAKLTERYTGANRGAVGVLMGGAKMNQYGFSPEQMDLRSLHHFPEERISAVFGVAAVIVGLGAGLEHSIYNNYHEAREAFTEDTLLPLYAFDQDTINNQITPEFTSDKNIIVQYDITKLRSLQEDQNAKYVRVIAAYKENLITQNQALSELGFPPVPDGDRLRAEVAPAPLPAAGGGPPGQKARQPFSVGNLDDMPDILQALVDLAEPAMQADLERNAERQRKTVKRRLIAGG